MASNRLESMSQVKAKSLECPICHDRFNDPRILPQCLHSFCSGCLVNLANGTTQIKCPMCQESIIVPRNGAQAFPSNFQLRQIVEEAAMHDSLLKDAKVMCDCHEGGEESEAVARCFECNEYLCVSGVDSHGRYKQLKSHPVASLEDIRSGKVRPRAMGNSSTIWCKNHPEEEAKLYCDSTACDVPICNTCCTLNHRDTKKHNCIDIKDAVPLLRKRVADYAKRLGEISTNLEHDKERNEQVVNTIQGQADRKKALITTRVEEAKGKLEEDKTRLHETVDAITVKETQPYDRLAKDLKKTVMQTKNAHEQAAGLEEANDGEFMQMYDVMKEKMVQLTLSRRPDDPRGPGNIDWPEWSEEQKTCCIL